jgi:hypothetical protein
MVFWLDRHRNVGASSRRVAIHHDRRMRHPKHHLARVPARLSVQTCQWARILGFPLD